jgi:hypothetical protein
MAMFGAGASHCCAYRFLNGIAGGTNNFAQSVDPISHGAVLSMVDERSNTIGVTLLE